MTDLHTALSRVETAQTELNRAEAALRPMEREYWTKRGFSVLPRRERLKAALVEDAALPTPLELWIESAGAK